MLVHEPKVSLRSASVRITETEWGMMAKRADREDTSKRNDGESNSNDDSETGPLLIGLLRDHLLLIGGAVLVFGLLGFVLGSIRTGEFRASAFLLVSDPGSGTVFAPLDDGGGARIDDYIESEITVLLSSQTVERAIALAGDRGRGLTPEAVRASTTAVHGDGLTIDVEYRSEDADVAVAMVNSLLASYETTVTEARRARYQGALDSVAEALETAQQESAQMESELRERSMEGAVSDDLEQRLQANLLALAEIRSSLGELTAADEATVAFELEALGLEIEAMRALLGAQDPDPLIATQIDRAAEAIRRESDLRARQLELEVDLGSTEQIVRTFPATTADTPVGGVVASTAAGLILGLFLAVYIAYWRWETSAGSRGDAG